jgi:hypothetical protein
MGKMETTISINAQLLILKPIPLVASLTHDCTKGDNDNILLLKCFHEHIKLFKIVILNSNYRLSLYIII